MINDIEKDRHYSGVFNICGEELQGELIYNKSNGVILVHVAKAITIDNPVGRHYQDIDVIVGKINTGQTVTLFNNRCTKNHTNFLQNQQLCFVADYLVWAAEDVTDKKFNRYTCVVSNALAWSGLSKIDTRNPYEIKIQTTSNSKVCTLFGTKVVFSTTIKQALSDKNNEALNISEHLVISIESPDQENIPFFIDIRNKILSLISFAIRDNVNIENQYLENKDDVYQIENQVEYIKNSLWTSEFYLPILKTNMFDFNFKLAQLPAVDDELNRKLNYLVPVFNLYLSLFKYKDMPIEMIFLNIVQALETLHSRFFYEDNKNKFIESVENRFKNEYNYDEIYKLLLPDYQTHTSHIILYSRLNDLLIGNNDGLFTDYYMQELDFAQQVVDTRNYYTHYDKNKETKALKGEELIKAVNVLRLLLEYHICSLLQIDNTMMIKNNLSRIK